MGWYTASVRAIDDHNQMVKIHYKNFRRQYDEWIPRNSQRLSSRPAMHLQKEFQEGRALAQQAQKTLVARAKEDIRGVHFAQDLATGRCVVCERGFVGELIGRLRTSYALSECACAVLVQREAADQGVDLEKGETRFVCARCVAHFDNSTAPVLDVMGGFLQSLQSGVSADTYAGFIEIMRTMAAAQYQLTTELANRLVGLLSGHDTLLWQLVSVLGLSEGQLGQQLADAARGHDRGNLGLDDMVADDTSAMYRIVDSRARERQRKPLECGAAGSCFFQSVTTAVGEDAAEEGRSGPLRRAVVDQLEKNSPWLEPFYAPAADTAPQSWNDWLDKLRETTTYVEGEMEIIATCQVLGVNIEIIGKDEQSDRTFGPGGLGHVANRKETIVLLRYATANPHYRLAVESEEEAGGEAMSVDSVEDDSSVDDDEEQEESDDGDEDDDESSSDDEDEDDDQCESEDEDEDSDEEKDSDEDDEDSEDSDDEDEDLSESEDDPAPAPTPTPAPARTPINRSPRQLQAKSRIAYYPGTVDGTSVDERPLEGRVLECLGHSFYKVEFTTSHQSVRGGEECNTTETQVIEEVELRPEHEGVFWVWHAKVAARACHVSDTPKALSNEVFAHCFQRTEQPHGIATNAHIMKIVNNLPEGQVHSTKEGRCRLVEFGGFRDTGKVMEAAKAALSSSAGTECWELVGDERSKLGIFVGDHKAATEALARATASGNDGCSVRKYTESNVAALRELGKMFVHMQEDVETTVSHKFKLGHLIHVLASAAREPTARAEPRGPAAD